jgi:hypothetical protein
LVVARRKRPEAPFQAPGYPALPIVFVAVYAALFVGTAIAQPRVVIFSVAVMVGTYVLSKTVGQSTDGRR